MINKVKENVFLAVAVFRSCHYEVGPMLHLLHTYTEKITCVENAISTHMCIVCV